MTAIDLIAKWRHSNQSYHVYLRARATSVSAQQTKTRETKTRESLCGSPSREAGPLVALGPTSIIFFTSTQRTRHYMSSAQRSNWSYLCLTPPSTYTDLEVLGGLWNCPSAVRKADSILGY